MNVIDLAQYRYTLQLDTSQYSNAMKHAEGQAEGMKSKLSGVGDVLKTTLIGGLVTAGAAITGFAVKGFNDFKEFQAGMNEVFSLLPDISESAMKDMESQVKDFSKEFGRLPDEVVPALYESLSAGIPQDNVFSFLEVAQKAAKGGVTELETAVDGISSVINAYGQDILSATKASDLMFVAVKNGKTTYEELSRSLYNVIPTASALGVSFDDITAAIGSMTAKGTPTSVVTTQLRQLFVELSKSGSNAAEVFESIANKSFREFIAEGGNTQQALALLEQEAQKSGIGINDFFGSVEAGSAALSLSGKNTDSFIKNLEDMKNSAGATEQAFERMNTGIAPTLDRLKARFSVLALDLGDKVAPSIEIVLTSVMNMFEKIMPYIEGLFDYIAAQLPVFMDGVSYTFNFINSIIQPFLDIVKNIITTVQGASEETSASFGLIQQVVSSVFSTISSIVETFVTLFNVIWDKWGADITAFVTNHFNNIMKVVKDALDVITGIAKFFTALFKGDWDGMFKALGEIAVSAFKLINNVFKTAIDYLNGIVKAGFELMGAIASGLMKMLWDGLKSIWNSIADWFSDSWNSLINWFGSLGESFINIGSNILNWVWEGLKDVWNDIVSWITDAVNWIADKLMFWRSSQNEMSQDTSTTSSNSTTTKNTTIPSTKSITTSPIKSYDVGTPFVTHDQLAFIHAGEAVLTAAQNPWNPANKLSSSSTNPPINNNYDHGITISHMEVKADDIGEFIESLKQYSMLNRFDNV